MLVRAQVCYSFGFGFIRMSLARFYDAQASSSVGYETALAEIRRGRKTSHWIWYIFPQLAGLGRSATARSYALDDLAQACAYLRDLRLRGRYEEIAGAVSHQLAQGTRLDELMGSRIDALKFVSSVTLFRAAAQHLAKEEVTFESLAHSCNLILQQTAAQGYPACAHTLAALAD